MAAGLQPEALAKYPSAFKGRAVLVLGDVMLDRYVAGAVSRISPEAPIPVLKASGARALLGGAGNVAANIAALGGAAMLVGSIGADAAGAELQALIEHTPGLSSALVTHPKRATTVKTRFTSGGHQLLRLDEESDGFLAPEEESAILARFASALEDIHVVVLSDYAKGVLTDRVLAEAIALSRARGRPVIADPKRVDLSAYRGAAVLTPNTLEASRSTGVAIHSDSDAAEAGRRALENLAGSAILITRAERGVSLVRENAPTLHLPTRAQAVADVSGAGDTVTATLAMMLAAGATLPEAAAMGNIAAGIAVSKPGTATISPAELADALAESGAASSQAKVVDLAAALQRLAQWRSAGARIGFTNGCFDLVHPGHIRILEAARRECDRLIVGLNSDASVRRLKGATRPVQSQVSRAAVIAALACTDLVVVFDEDTPLELIRALAPDRLIKGADYAREAVVGGDVVEARGGKVILVPLEPGHSTTAIVSRLAAQT